MLGLTFIWHLGATAHKAQVATTEHPRETVEASLAHTVGDAVERACRRADYLAKRRALMDDWAAYLAKVGAPVARIRPFRSIEI